MSAPTKGSVAGQPIQTGTQTKEWDEGFDRTFGERKPARGRFVYTSGGEALPAPIAVDEAWTGAERRAGTPTEELVYGGLGTATDGTPINSRTKHREYCKAHNVALVDDFKETWAKDAQQREAIARGDYDRKARREAIGRAAYEAEKRRRK